MFIKISDNICINSEQVAWVSKSEIGSTIYVGDREYPCDMPYESLVAILQGSLEKKPDKTMEKLDKFLSVAQITRL
jgi:hypothetical protein